MKGTDQFTAVIKAYLDNRAKADELFRVRYESVNRPIEDIVTYIIGEVQKSGRCGFSDEEIFSLAIHAAEEPELTICNRPNCTIVSNHTIELTEEEKAEQRAIALKRYQEEQLYKLKERENRPKTAKTTAPTNSQPNLFDF